MEIHSENKFSIFPTEKNYEIKAQRSKPLYFLCSEIIMLLTSQHVPLPFFFKDHMKHIFVNYFHLMKRNVFMFVRKRTSAEFVLAVPTYLLFYCYMTPKGGWLSAPNSYSGPRAIP